jgi:RNA-directed DNA polymerase
VTENQGKQTPGVDRVTWETPEQNATAIATLRPRGYRPQPLRRVYIAKSNVKRRGLGIPTMKDRAMQALYLPALDPIAETQADPNSYGYRTHRAPANAIEHYCNVLAKKASPQWTPQGGICSPVIANMALEGLEARLRTAFPRYVWNGRNRCVQKPTSSASPMISSPPA